MAQKAERVRLMRFALCPMRPNVRNTMNNTEKEQSVYLTEYYYILSKHKNDSDISTPPPGTPMGRVASSASVDDYWSSPEERVAFVSKYGEEETVKMETAGKARLAASGRS